MTGNVGILKPNIIDGVFSGWRLCRSYDLNSCEFVCVFHVQGNIQLENEDGVDVLSTSVWNQSYTWCLTCSNVQPSMARSLPETFLAVATRYASTLAVKGPVGMRDGGTKQ